MDCIHLTKMRSFLTVKHFVSLRCVPEATMSSMERLWSKRKYKVSCKGTRLIFSAPSLARVQSLLCTLTADTRTQPSLTNALSVLDSKYPSLIYNILLPWNDHDLALQAPHLCCLILPSLDHVVISLAYYRCSVKCCGLRRNHDP